MGHQGQGSGMPRFVSFRDFKGQPIVVNADQVIYVRAFGGVGKTEIAFAAAQQNGGQQNGALCIVVQGTVESVTSELNGGLATARAPARAARTERSRRSPVPEPSQLVAFVG
jgi:hypothetical protein